MMQKSLKTIGKTNKKAFKYDIIYKNVKEVL